MSEMNEANVKSYENLANAIILLAVNDYRAAKKRLRGFPTSRDALAVCREVRRFFLSAYFGNLTKLDGRLLLEQLDKEAEA